MTAPRSSPFLRVGVPLFALTIGGWLGISTFLQARLDLKDARTTVTDMSAPVEKQRAKKFSLDEELHKVQNKIVEEKYQNKAIERLKDW